MRKTTGHRTPKGHDPDPTPTVVTPSLDTTAVGGPLGGRRSEGTPPAAGAFGRGETLGRYVVIDRLGAGGMGVVYAAYDPSLERKVALKLLHPRTRSRALEVRQRLLREAQALARLSHPNVVTIYDVGTVGEQIFLAMEHVAGLDLAAWLRQHGPQWREILELFLQAGRGLAAAHEAGLVHRDFKTSNVMVRGADRCALVLDFGLARAGEGTRVDGNGGDGSGVVRLEDLASSSGADALGSGGLTREGSRLGTPAFMAPEQWRGQPAGPEADQFSFCVALFRALYGEPPFAPGPAGQGPPDWSEVTSPEGRGIPAPLRRILLRGLSLHPEDRYPSMEDLLARLEGVPRRRRRLALAAAAVPIALVSALVLRGPGAEPPCRSAPGQLAEVWNEERRAAVVAGFSAIPRPYAPLVAVAVGEALDAYGRGWVSQHVDACEATHVRGEQSAALLDLRMACLDQRQRELDALVGLFQEDPAATVETAFQAVGELANPDACADTRALLAPMSEPVDAESRRRVAEVRDELASVAALQATGRYSEGAELAADLVERTKTIRYLPLAAEALLRLGRLQEGAGEPAQATDSLQHALWTAQAGGHERVAAEAFIRLVRVVGFQQADFERGRFYAEMADALVERLGETGRLRSTLADHLGLLAFQEGQYAAAAEHHRQAVEERQRLGAGADAVTETGVAQSLVRLGTALLEQGALEEAEAELQKALEIYLPRLGSEHPDVAATFDRLGTVAYRGGDLETAEGLYRRSLEAFSQGLGAGHPKVAAGCMHLGNVLTARGDAASALELYDRALQIYSSSLGENHPHVAIAWTNVGATRVELGEHQSAVEAFGRALEIQRGVYGDDHPWVATTVFNLGETLNELGNFGAAERQHRSALEVFRRSYGDTHPMVAHGLHGLGRALHGQGRNDPALPLLEEALEVWNGAGQDPRHAAETRWLMAQLLVAEDRPRAIELAREAVAGFRASEGDHRAQQEAALGWLSDQGAEGRS